MDNLSIKKKVKLIYPPSPLFQRGEDRCQANIDSSSATSIRACNDLGYVASVLRHAGYDVSIKDYQTELFSIENVLNDLEKEKIDVLFLSVTNATIYDDLKFVNLIKEKFPNLVILLKGAIFFDINTDFLKKLDLSSVDYLIGGEVEFIISELLNSHFNDKNNLCNISGILYKNDCAWVKNNYTNIWQDDLDSIPFPARDLMNNSLYIRPDTGEVQATISTSRGCPSSCIYCLTPIISGKKLRLRTPQSVLDELKECYEKFGIKNFFFKADTFTFNKDWTIKLCELIINSSLYKKIQWVANSRVNPIDFETLSYMKKAGCWLVAFGFESGSQKSLDLMKKGTTVEQNIQAMKLAKKAGLKVFGFYMIGFPWETMADLKKTKDLIFKNNADFIEIHLAIPYYGTPLSQIALESGLIKQDILGNDYFNSPCISTNSLSIEEIQKYRKNLLLSYYLRPSYIIKKCFSALKKPIVLKNYLIYGIRLIKNCFK